MGISRERFDRLKTRFLSNDLTDEEYLELRQLMQSQGSFKLTLFLNCTPNRRWKEN